MWFIEYTFNRVARLAPTHAWTIAGLGNLDGDGKSDILWRGAAGDVVVSLTNGFQIASSAAAGNVPANWIIAGTGDFNGDLPVHKHDILWRNALTGDLVVSLMDGAVITSSTFVANVPLNWSVVAVADFNGDGKADILWRDTTGNVVVSLMNGAQIVSSTWVGIPPSPATNWTVAGTGDFNGDGKADILWRTVGGDVWIWFMNGAQLTSSAMVATPSANWSIAAVGDFDGDSRSDIVWRENGGAVVVWLMNGAIIAASGLATNLPFTWELAGAGDFDGDGKSDLVWRESATGNVVISKMNGAQIVSSTLVASGVP